MISLKDFFFKIQLFLIPLIPISLIIGPAISDIIVSITSLSFLIYISIKPKNFNFLKNNFFYLFFLFYIYILLLSIFSNYPILSLESSLFYIRFILFLFSINLIVSKEPKVFKYLFLSMSLAFGILIIDSYYQYFFKVNLLGFKYDGIRLSGLFNEEKILGSYLSRLTPIYIGLIIYLFGNSKIKIISSLVLVITVDLLVILSGERTSIFYIFLSTFLIAILIKRWKLYRITAFFISLFLSLIILTTNNLVKERVIDKTLNQTNILGPKINAFSIQHEVIYLTALKIFKDNIVFGIGPKNFRLECKKDIYKSLTNLDKSVDGCQTHPHNTYIQLLTETGVIGFLFVFSFFIYLNFMIIRHFILMIFKKIHILNDYEICFIIALYINLWPLVPTGNFFNNWLSIIYFLPLGLILNKFVKLDNKL